MASVQPEPSLPAGNESAKAQGLELQRNKMREENQIKDDPKKTAALKQCVRSPF
jgi:hypothetical protein